MIRHLGKSTPYFGDLHITMVGTSDIEVIFELISLPVNELLLEAYEIERL